MNIPLIKLIDLATEWWRLNKWLLSSSNPTAAARARRMASIVEGILDPHGISVHDFTGTEFLDGLAIEVVDLVLDPQVTPGAGRISETLSPTISLGDSIVSTGQVIVCRHPDSLPETPVMEDESSSTLSSSTANKHEATEPEMVLRKLRTHQPSKHGQPPKGDPPNDDDF